MPACEPTDEKLRRNNSKDIALGTRIVLFVVHPPVNATTRIKRTPFPQGGGATPESLDVRYAQACLDCPLERY